jgi:hypothetical protein
LIASAAATIAVAAVYVVGTLLAHQEERPDVVTVFPIVHLIWIGSLLVLIAALWGWFVSLRYPKSAAPGKAGDADARRGINGWEFLVQWLVASAAGMTLGVTLGASGKYVFADLIYQLWPENLPLGTLFYLRESLHLIPFALALGASVGFMQWLVLRQHLNFSSGWIWAAALGWPLGWSACWFAVEQWKIAVWGFQSPQNLYFFYRTNPTGLFAVTGVVVGGFLFLLYRSHIRFFALWIAACATGAAAAGAVWYAVPSYLNADLLQAPYPPGTAFLSGLAFGAVTGIGLMPLLRRSRRMPAKGGA